MRILWRFSTASAAVILSTAMVAARVTFLVLWMGLALAAWAAAPTDYLHYWHPSRDSSSEDYGPGNYDGTPTSVTAGSDGWVFPARTTAGYITLPGPIANTASYSFSFWAKPDTSEMDKQTYGGWVISDRESGSDPEDWQFAYRNDGTWKLSYWAPGDFGASYSAPPPTDDVWAHVTVTVASNQVVIYANGTETTNVTGHGTPVDTYAGDTIIGNWSWSAPNDAAQYRGYLDNLKFYQRVLSAAEVSALYSEGRIYSGGEPTLANGGVTDIQETSADVAGTLFTPGASAAQVYLYWATDDYETNAADWVANGSVTNFGPFAAGATFTNTITGLSTGTVYYYNHMASNDTYVAWAATGGSPSFETDKPWTDGNVTWSGGAGAGNPYWNVSNNWAGGQYPGVSTPGTVILGTTAGESSKFEADRTMATLQSGKSGLATSHTIDLNTHTLTIEGDRLVLVNDASAQGRLDQLTVSNGTVRIGSDTASALLQVQGQSTLTFGSGAKLDTHNATAIALSASNRDDARLDLRGAEVVGGALTATNVTLGIASWFGSHIYLDNSTSIDAIVVRNALNIANGSYGRNVYRYIGDPGNSGNLPPDIDVQVGVDASNRGSLTIGRSTTHYAYGKLTASSGGSLVAYLSSLRVGVSGTASADTLPSGSLNIEAMTNCTIDTVAMSVGTDRGTATDNCKGYVYLPAGTITAGDVTVGGVGLGIGRVRTSNTVFTVTNSITLKGSADVQIRLDGTPSGLDVEKGFTDDGGSIAVTFLEAPSVGTNWAIRIAGDAQSTLDAMIGAGRLTSTGTFPGKDVGVIYDAAAGYTYYAMADSNAFASLPVAIAHDELTHEMAAGGSVVLGTNDIDNGSYDPGSRPLTLTLSTNGGPEEASVTFGALGDYVVTLTAAAGGDSATDTCTVHVVSLSPGTNGNVVWLGDASTELMDRREWFWSDNWVGGLPPTNPTTATVYLQTQGQDVTGRLGADRTVQRLQSGVSGFKTTHTLDLNTHTLTIAGDRLVLVNDSSSGGRRDQLTVSNGTVRIGSDAAAAQLVVEGQSTLIFGPGAKLDTHNATAIALSPASNRDHSYLDLRGAEVVGGTLSATNLTLAIGSWFRGHIYVDSATMLSAIVVRNTLSIANGAHSNTDFAFIGDPADQRLPPNIDVRVGAAAGARGSLTVGRSTTHAAYGKLAASSGGDFVAYLSNLRVGVSGNAGADTMPYGILDIAGMTNCTIDTLTMSVGTDRGTGTDNCKGYVYLPPGTVTAGDVTVGGAGVGTGLVTMSNTVFTVTNSMAIEASGDVAVQVGSVSGGVIVQSAGAGALTVADGATISLQFLEPAAALPHYGLRWAGEHVDAVAALVSAGKLVIDGTGLGEPASVYYTMGATHVGLPPAGGTMFMVR